MPSFLACSCSVCSQHTSTLVWGQGCLIPQESKRERGEGDVQESTWQNNRPPCALCVLQIKTRHTQHTTHNTQHTTHTHRHTHRHTQSEGRWLILFTRHANMNTNQHSKGDKQNETTNTTTTTTTRQYRPLHQQGITALQILSTEPTKMEGSIKPKPKTMPRCQAT